MTKFFVFLKIVAIVLMVIGSLAVPFGIGAGIYQWAVVDIALKAALWIGFKAWLTGIACLIIGYILFVVSMVLDA